jgi:hypothetical protein
MLRGIYFLACGGLATAFRLLGACSHLRPDRLLPRTIAQLVDPLHCARIMSTCDNLPSSYCWPVRPAPPGPMARPPTSPRPPRPQRLPRLHHRHLRPATPWPAFTRWSARPTARATVSARCCRSGPGPAAARPVISPTRRPVPMRPNSRPWPSATGPSNNQITSAQAWFRLAGCCRRRLPHAARIPASGAKRQSADSLRKAREELRSGP